MSWADHSESPNGQFAKRVFWLVVAGVAAIWLAPEIADDVGIKNSYSTTSATILIVSIMTLVQVVLAWLAAGIVCGLIIERQPWYRSLYLLVPLVLYCLGRPGIR